MAPALEPMLIQGTMICLGDVDVHRHYGAPNTKLEVIQTAVFKVVIYRDELAIAWADLARQPIRCLLQLLPTLQLCKGTGCGPDCACFHAPVEEELDSVIQEVWARKFFGHEWEGCRPCACRSFPVLPSGSPFRSQASAPDDS